MVAMVSVVTLNAERSPEGLSSPSVIEKRRRHDVRLRVRNGTVVVAHPPMRIFVAVAEAAPAVVVHLVEGGERREPAIVSAADADKVAVPAAEAPAMMPPVVMVRLK